MDTTAGTRGIVIGDRYRVAGALRRTGLIDAVDLEADRTEAACRIVGVPGDAERVDQWEDAWRAVHDAGVPRLREIVADDDGAHWAVLAPSCATELPLPPDAAVQARAIGEALAAAGLDVGDIARGMLVTDATGCVRLDGVVWLGGDRSPRTAGRVVAELLPPSAADDDEPVRDPGWSPPPRRARRPVRRSRVLVPLAIVAALAAAGLVLLLPQRSSGTAVMAPAATGGADDVILGAAPVVVTPVDAPAQQPSADLDGEQTAPIDAAAPAPVEVETMTVTVIVPAPAAPEVALPQAVVPELPPAAADQPADLPLATPVPALPVVGGG